MPGVVQHWETDVLADSSLLNRVIELYERREQTVSGQINEQFAQKLLGALLRIQACEHRGIHCESTVEALGKAKEALREVIDAARRLAGQLRSPLLNEFNVVCGIEYLLGGMEDNANREIEFLHPGRLDRMSPHVEIAVFRIVQELLNNASRHSRAKKIRVQLSQDANLLRLEVRDWGVGFDPHKVGECVSGLQSLRDRVALLDGRIDIDAALGRGARVVVELPLAGVKAY